MSLVDRSFRRELASQFQDRDVRVFANGLEFRGRLFLIGRNFLKLRTSTRRILIRTRRVIAVSRLV